MRNYILAVAVFATIAIASGIDDECIQRKVHGLPVHWPNPTNCSSFYRCTNKNIKRELLCPDGKEYNSKTGRCASKERSLCRLSLRAPLPKAANNFCADKISGTFLPDPKSCRDFVICNNELSYPQSCDAGSYFNSTTSACELDTQTVCWENLCIKKSNGVNLPNKNDCYGFYICYEEKPVPQKCPTGSFFNDESLNCQPGQCPTDATTTSAPETTTTPCTGTTTTTTCAPETTTTPCTGTTTTTTCGTETTTTPCTGTTTTTTCATETTTTPWTGTTTTTTCAPETTTTPCTGRTTTTTCAPETTTTPCTGTTTTTTCAPETTTTPCTETTTATTCAPETTTTPCTGTTTTTTCTPETTTTCAPETTTTTTTCAAETTTTTCAPDTTATTTPCAEITITTTSCAGITTTTTTCAPTETTTPTHNDHLNFKCNKIVCTKNNDGFVFPALNTNEGFCVCLKQKAEYRACSDNSMFNEAFQICMPHERICPSSRCSTLPNASTFNAFNTTNGFCICFNGKANFIQCVGNDYVYDSTLGVCVAATTGNLCKGGYREGDFVPHPQNCMLFYICYEGQLEEISCGRGNYYDVHISACMPDARGRCPHSHLPTAYSVSRRSRRSIRAKCVEGSKTPAADCDKYYKCSAGHQLLYGCGKYSFFNYTTLACQIDVEHVCWPANSCTENEKIPYPDDDTKYYQCIDGKLVLKSCDSNSYYHKPSMSCMPRQECTCPGGYEDGEISPHPTDCDKFYICKDGEQKLQECGKGNYFNKTSISCEKDVENTCNSEKPCLCPGGYQQGDLSPHPSDCDKYYICEGGKQVLHTCGKNNYFDNSTLTCKTDDCNECWPKEETCTCPGGYKEGDFSAHPKDCSKYYICYNGQQVLQDCGTNNYFNTRTLACEPDNYYVCWPNLCIDKPNGTLVANPKQCNAFFLCENNNAAAKSCLEGQWFDRNALACVADLKAVCYNPCAKEKNEPVVLLPHPTCNKYYFCNDGKTFVGTCKVGKFDITTGVCNEEEKCFPNPCDNSSISAFPDPYDNAKFYWCNKDKQPIPETCPPGMEFIVEYKACKKVSDPDCAACSKDGYYPTLRGNTETEFCVCVDGLATKIECPQDYVFNKELGICYSNAPCDPSFCQDAKEYDTAPNRIDNKSFCMCINKKPIIVNCPNNGTFNPYTLKCSDDEISPECLQSTCVSVTNNSYVFKPINTKTSNGFCQCVNQIATFRPCHYGSKFNPDLLICQLTEINCNSYQCHSLPNNSLIPAVTTTQGYCKCIAGKATYYNCPKDGEFNVTSSQCEAPLCDLTRCGTAGNENKPFAASLPNGFCLCEVGYVACHTKGTVFSEKFGNCIEPCSKFLCDGKPDKHLVSSLINNHSFCLCHANPMLDPSYEVCPSESYVFEESKQRCLVNSEEQCGTDECKAAKVFEAKDSLKGFCLCLEKSKKPIYEECLQGIFVPDKYACLPTAADVCDMNLCAEATIGHPITLPANNSIIEFCYCSSPTNAMLLPCPHGKYYNPAKGMCVNEIEEYSGCPNGVAENGNVPDLTTCNKYYLCKKGSLELHTCPAGQFFKVDVNDCVPDTQGICIKTSNCTCLGIYYENELLPHPIKPQMYYKCRGNTLHEFKCTSGRIFSAQQKQCIVDAKFIQKRSLDLGLDQEFGCVENEKRSVPSNCSQYEICAEQTWQRKICSNYRYYNPEQRECVEPRDDFVCSYAKVTSLPTCNTAMRSYLLNAKICHQYYRCLDGKWHLKSCGRQQYFNVKKSTCLPVPQDDSFTCESLTSSNTTATNDNNLACQHLSQRYYGKNCAMYLICLDNEWWYQYCPPDMFYNRTLNYCAHDNQQQCMDTIRTEVTANVKAEFSNELCQQDGLLRPSSMGCNRYFVCLNGKWQLQYCAKGEFYDVENVQCTIDTWGVCKRLANDCLPQATKAVARNCSSYEKCSEEGKWIKFSCPPNEMYDELSQQCVFNQGICSKHGVKRVCRQFETLPVNKNCSVFYYCDQDTWRLGKCLQGFMYSREKQMCIAHTPQDHCKPLSLNETSLKVLATGQQSVLCQGKMEGTAVAHPTDCSRYFICSQQSLIHEMQCPRGSYFAPNHGYCRPNDGSCRLPLTGVCANAADESLVPHPSDCQSFYKCSTINGAELLQCPEGEYFHNVTRQCLRDHGECKTKVLHKSKCFGLKHGTRLAHDIYCNMYYACVKGLAILVQCPDNYHFNSLLEKCVLDKEHQCHGGHLKKSNATYTCEGLFDGSYFPNLSDCTRYYICTQGQALPKKCTNSSYFDSEQMMCMPDDGACPFVNIDEGHHNPIPPDPSVCEGKHGYLLPDPLNCNNFYACIHSKLKLERCYARQFFNTTMQQCQQNNDLTVTDTKVILAKSEKRQCMDEVTSFKNLCSELSEGTSLAEPGDCRRYVTCQNVHEEPVTQRCRNGESFDSLLGFCRQNDGTCLLENGQRVGECSGKHGQLVKDPNNCRGYFVCINGQKISQNCKADEYFSKTKRMCSKDTQNVCQKNEVSAGQLIQQSCVGLSESILYPYIHDNCRSYFQCIKGSAKIHRCADDLYFDAVKIKCTKIKSACEMPNQTLQRSPVFSQKFTKLCSNKELEYPYANLDNECRSFYFCHANGEVSHELCPLGMIFNQKLVMCTNEKETICTPHK